MPFVGLHLCIQSPSNPFTISIPDPSPPGPGGLGFCISYCVGSRPVYPVWARRSPGNRHFFPLQSLKTWLIWDLAKPFLLPGLFQTVRWGRVQRLPGSRPKGRAIKDPADQSSLGWSLRPWTQWFMARSQYIKSGRWGREPGGSLRLLGKSEQSLVIWVTMKCIPVAGYFSFLNHKTQLFVPSPQNCYRHWIYGTSFLIPICLTCMRARARARVCECRHSIYSVYGRSWWIDPEGTWL